MLIPIFFLGTVYENEHAKMLSFMLSKETIVKQQSILGTLEARNKEIEKKLTLLTLNQVLPPKVSEAITQGKKVIN